MNKLFKKLRRQGGFTLVELIAATLIIVLVATMLVSSYGLAMRLMIRGKDHENALDKAYGRLDTQNADYYEDAVMKVLVRINGVEEVWIEIPGRIGRQNETENDSEVRLTIFEYYRPGSGR